MKRIVFDIEADGLIETATKIHCLCWYDIDTKESGQETTYGDMLEIFFEEDLTLIGHKIITYDVPMLEKFLSCDLSSARQIDTLTISQYLYPKEEVHGLDMWGKRFGIEKPPIDIWVDDGTPEFLPRMLHRCSEDVKINVRAWELFLSQLMRIYAERGQVSRIINYLSFKAKCAREQEEEKLRIDKEKCEKNLAFLEGEKKKKIDVLRVIMPRQNVYSAIRSMPKVMHKKDGTLSEHAKTWYERLKKQSLPEYHNGAFKEIVGTEEGNPTSHPQLKEWLFSLGWEPTTFKYVRDKDKATGLIDYSSTPRKIPQIGSDDNTGLCESVKALFEKEPRLEELESLFIINHRIGLLKGFLENIDENNFLKAELPGFTNTLRFTHKKPIANLPQIPKLYWKEVRECIIAPSDKHVLCNADMSGLEDRTKMHYIYNYDAKYVEDMMQPGFDPHLYIAVRAGLLTQEEVDWYKDYEKRNKGYKEKGIIFIVSEEELAKYERIKGIRLKAKKTNFAAIYGAGAPKIAVTANIPLREAQIFHTAYWIVNAAIIHIVNNTIVQTVDNQMWLWNPVAQLWYSLKTRKDIFSTLNQGTGAYCFDTWTRYCREEWYKICMQYHDEHTSAILIGEEEKARGILTRAIDKTNEELKLNVKLGISIEFGKNYAAIH